MKHILALPMWHQICLVMELQAYEINSFKTGHPVCYTKVNVQTTNVTIKQRLPQLEKKMNILHV